MALSCRTPVRAVQRSAAVRPAVSRVSTVRTRASLDSVVAVGGSTVAFLALGRFVFLPFQRRTNADNLPPKATGNAYFDKLQQPASFVGGSKDPAGFGIVDVLGWGALGHAFGFFLLAASSLNAAGVAAFPH